MPAPPGPGGSGKGTQQSASKAVQGSNIFGSIAALPGKWLSGLGGQLGSGIESAFVSGLTDLFDIIIGPLEIIVGFWLIMFGIMIFFKDDIMNLIRLAGGIGISGAAAA